MPYLTRTDDIWELYLGTEGVELDVDNPENRFSTAWMTAMNELLDQVEADASGALVLTATGKFFSNGLDVAELSNGASVDKYLDRVHAIYARLLTLPVTTVAAVNGHAFGGGAMLALCADHRIMRTERGYWCLPEVTIGLPFADGMEALLYERLPESTRVDAMTTGRRYSGHDAAAAGIVDNAVDVESLLTSARSFAAERTDVAGAGMATIKKSLRRRVLADLAPRAQ